MSAGPIRDNDDLWERVTGLIESLRSAGSEADADRLQAAMTISAHPGEVWPETLATVRRLLAKSPPGLDEQSASACAEYLSRWP